MATKKTDIKGKGLYRVINHYRLKRGIKRQADLAAELDGRQSANLWDGIRKNRTKFNDVLAIADKLKLKVIIRDDETNTEHIMNENK